MNELDTVPDKLEEQSELAGLKLEIEDLKRQLHEERSLKNGIERGKEEEIKERTECERQKFFELLTEPLSFLLLQQSLAAKGVPVKTEDVLRNAAILVRNLSEAGLQPLHEAGVSGKFSSETMQCLAEGYLPEEGEVVAVKIPGFSFQNRVIRKSFINKDINNNGKNSG